MKRHTFEGYVSRMEEIRRLSSPNLGELNSADEYSERLRHNFERIGVLAGENRKMLDQDLFPLLDSEKELTEEQIESMTSLGEALMDASDLEMLDLPIMSLISNRLMEDAQKKDELSHLLRQLDIEIATCYSMMNMTERIVTCPKVSEGFREKGMAIGKFFLSFLDKDKFQKLDEKSRELVLTNSRYAIVFYEGLRCDSGANRENLFLIDKMLEISEDPFYLESVPGFDWNYFIYRTLQYAASGTDYNNEREFSGEELAKISEYSDRMEQMMESDPAYFTELDRDLYIHHLAVRNRYLVGKIDRKTYQEKLLSLYRKRNKDIRDDQMLFENILFPVDYICILDPENMTAEERMTLKGMYQDICAYILGVPNVSVFSYLLEFFAAIIRYFIEIPSGLTFERMVLQCLAALHPPTYIHSMMVGQLTECMCGHLLKIRPDLFLGICGCQKLEEVNTRKASILDFAYHAALCHDFGKIPIIDTIFVYGRKLLDFEFNIIRQHPQMGYEMLISHELTRTYADVARGHHRWYDNSRGYPEEFDTSKSPVKTIIDLVMCADCMDAATDSVGRSYNKGKTLQHFLEEVNEGVGTRYAPWLLELFDSEHVRRDVEYLLTSGRQQNYRETYNLLKNVQVKGKN